MRFIAISENRSITAQERFAASERRLCLRLLVNVNKSVKSRGRSRLFPVKYFSNVEWDINCEAFCLSFILMVLKIYFFGMEQCHKMLWFNTVHLFNFSQFISILSVCTKSSPPGIYLFSKRNIVFTICLK